MIPQSRPIRFTAKGLTDAFDATDEFKGACQSLSNLIFDQSNPELVIPRPGVQQTGAIPNSGFVSTHVTVGTRIYGMVASAAFAGHDEPFCYDTSTTSFVPITGVTAANTPTSPISVLSDWTPPTIAPVGVYLVVTHPGFNGTGTLFFGLIDLSNPAIPIWSSANCTTNPLTAVPKAVANLNNRAYFAVKNQVQFSDVLNPKVRTNATQALTISDTEDINALSGLPVQTTSSGVVGALVIWKTSQLWQVTGDPTTNDLAENFISLTVGTLSPRTIAQSPAGVYFISTSGPYFIDPLGTLRPLTVRVDSAEPDVQLPFINATRPSRWAGAYASSIYRVCGPAEIDGTEVTQDYWFDEHRRRWSGPHTFAYDCASTMKGFFILSSYLHGGVLCSSDVVPKLSTVYTDLGATYTVDLQSSTFPKTGDMCMKQVVESQIELGGSSVTYTITAEDEAGNVLDSVTITTPASNVPVWGGGAVWGDGTLWTGARSQPPLTYPVPWTKPLVFEKLQLHITAPVSSSLKIGTFFARYQQTGYMTPGPTP